MATIEEQGQSMNYRLKDLVHVIKILPLAFSSAIFAAHFSSEVSVERAADGVWYHYTITNLDSYFSPKEIYIGLIDDPIPNFPENEKVTLASRPFGYFEDQTTCGETGCAIGLETGAYSVSTPWSLGISTIQDQEERLSLGVYSDTVGLKKGNSVHFSIKTRFADPSYANAKYQIRWNTYGGYFDKEIGDIHKSDITPPTFAPSINNLMFGSNDDQLVDIDLKWSVSDDQDSKPEVMLTKVECITNDEKFQIPSCEQIILGNDGHVPVTQLVKSCLPQGELFTSEQCTKFVRGSHESLHLKAAQKFLKLYPNVIFKLQLTALDASGNQTQKVLPIEVGSGNPLAYGTGDVNKDRCVDIHDMSLLLKAIREKSTNNIYDINKDGVVNTLDRAALTALFTNTGGASCN